MVYKKYIKRNGKLYGPYLYHSRRVNGKVVSEYQGINEHPDKKKIFFIIIGLLLLAVSIYFLISSKLIGSGKAVLNLQAEYKEQEPFKGRLEISLNEGEFIPASSQIIFENSGKTYEYNLEDIVEESTPVEGNFSVEGSLISGDGLGYGFSQVLQINLSKLNLDFKQGQLKAVILYDNQEILSLSSEIKELKKEPPAEQIPVEQQKENQTEEIIIEQPVSAEVSLETERTEIPKKENSTITNTPVIVMERDVLLNEQEKSALENKYGNFSAERKARLFKDRIIIRYELEDKWIENSYDASMNSEQLELKTERDRILWLKDIAKEIMNKETKEQEIKEMEKNFPIAQA